MIKLYPNVLAVDAATKICSVALRDATGIIHERTEIGIGIHSEKLFLFIQELLNETSLTINSLDAVVVTSGPGSYTGLRIGASAVKGLLFNQNVPLFGVNTLAYFALNAFRINNNLTKVHAVLDARRVHVYHQTFIKNDKLKPLSEVQIREISTLLDLVEVGDGIAGTGIRRIPKALLDNTIVTGEEEISSGTLIDLLDQFSNQTDDQIIKKVAPEQFVPYYYGSTQVHGIARK